MAPKKNLCQVGVAFYTVPDYPTQWTFVVSNNRRFEGQVWCTTLMENTDGRGAISMDLDWSPACLDQRMIFSGVVAVVESPHPFDTLKDSIPMGDLVSRVNPSFPFVTWADIGRDSETYVGLILTHLCRARLISVPGMDLNNPTNLIRPLLGVVQKTKVPQMGNYPIVSLTGEVIFGDTRMFCAGTFLPSSSLGYDSYLQFREIDLCTPVSRLFISTTRNVKRLTD